MEARNRWGLDSVVSPFEKKHNRMTTELAEKRNRFIAEQADEILVAHANEGGKLDKFEIELMRVEKRCGL